MASDDSTQLALWQTDAPLRRCGRCREFKNPSEFNRKTRRSGKVGLSSWCKECNRKHSAAWRQADPHRAKKSNRRGHLKRLGLGVTLEDYDRMHAEQTGRCAICGCGEKHGKRFRGTPTQLSVDHDHATGHVRGLLCSTCNLMIGYANDNPATLRAAADYLEKHKGGEHERAG